MSDTPRLGLPQILAAQAQKHVTHNEALLKLDAFAHLYVLDRDLTAPPASPVDGDTYLIAVAATGDWAGEDGKLAYLIDGGWRFYEAVAGLRAHVDDENVTIIFDGASWSEYGAPPDYQNISTLGVNTTADATNKLAVKSNAVLFAALETANGGDGDVQFKVNKETSADTASLLFQTGWSGRAELGATGDDDFHLKVSPDGSTFHEAFVVDKDTGDVSFKNGMNFGGADTIEDYEIGTFTPFFTENTPTAAFTHDFQQGNYIRIGDFVALWIYLSTSAVSINGSTEKLRIGGLPFAGKNNASNHYGGVLYFTQGFTATSCPVSILLLENTSLVELEFHGSSDARSEIDVTVRGNHLSTTNNTVRAFIPFIAA